MLIPSIYKTFDSLFNNLLVKFCHIRERFINEFHYINYDD